METSRFSSSYVLAMLDSGESQWRRAGVHTPLVWSICLLCETGCWTTPTFGLIKQAVSFVRFCTNMHLFISSAVRVIFLKSRKREWASLLERCAPSNFFFFLEHSQPSMGSSQVHQGKSYCLFCPTLFPIAIYFLKCSCISWKSREREESRVFNMFLFSFLSLLLCKYKKPFWG